MHTNNNPYFILYHREDCHLCEDMLEQLIPYSKQYHFEFKMIDVDGLPELQQKYGLLVPVLCYKNKLDKIKNKQKEIEVCHYFLDVDKLMTFVKS